MTTPSLIWFLAEDDNAERLTAAIRAGQWPGETRRCRRVIELATGLETEPGTLAIIDLGDQPQRVLTELEPLVRRFDQIPFVLVSDRLDSDTLIHAMNIGIRQFIPRPMLSEQLPPILRRLIKRNGAENGSSACGTALTVLSAAGGCGATTLAINLAHELPAVGAATSLILDLDNAYGGVAHYLAVRGEHGLADLLDSGDRIDRELIASVALPCSDRLHAILNPVSVNFARPAPLRYEHLETTLGECRQLYRWTVIDAPRVPTAVAERLARQSSDTLIVGQLMVKDVRTMRDIQRSLLEAGIAQERIRCLINRFHSRHGTVTLDQAKRALGRHDVEVLSNEYHDATEGLSIGQPLAGCAPRSRLRREIQQLAKTLARTPSTAASH